MPSILKAYALSTAARVKDRLDIASATTTWDTLLERMINSATDCIERLCNHRRFKETTYTLEVYPGGDGTLKTVPLRNWPVTALSAAQYRAGTPDTPVWTAFAASEYELLNDQEPRRVRIYNFVPSGQNNLRFTYTAGYKINFSDESAATHTLPSDISDLCERMVVAKFKGRVSEGKINEAATEASMTWARELSADDKELIRQLKGFTF